jgi:hypothetical protein
MNNKKIFYALLTCLFLKLSPALAAPYFSLDARTLGMGGSGIANGVPYGSFNNPALLPLEIEFVNWTLLAPAIGQTQIDPDHLDNKLDTFQATANTPNLNEAASALQNLSDKKSNKLSFSSIMVAVPSSVLGAGAFLNIYEYTSSKTQIGTPDFSNPNAPEFNSTLEKRGISIIEQGVSVAHVFNKKDLGYRGLIIGLSPKFVLAQAVRTTEDIATADQNFRFKNIPSQAAFNLDVGLIQELGRYRLGLVVKNVLPMEFDYTGGGTVYLDPQARIGMSYQRRKRNWEIDLDLTLNRGIGFTQKSRYLSMGSEFHFTDYLYLRAGLRQNLVADQETALSLGVGFGTAYHFDLAVMGATNNELSGIAQLGFEF